jgi:hypothetical protein
VLVALSAVPLAAQSPEIETLVWKDAVYQGESFIYQVTVRGARNVREPNLDPLSAFEPREIPRQWLWSYQNDEHSPADLPEGRHFFLRLMASETGEVTIPSTTVFVDGRRRRTSPVTISVSSPPPQEDFLLELELDKNEVYVGEPLTLHAVWYARDSASFYFANIPLLRHPQVQLGERTDSGGSAGLFLRMSGGSQRLSGTRGTATRDGLEYQTLTLRQPLVIQSSGSYDFPRATVQVWRSRQVQSRTRAYRGYRQTVVGSNGLGVRVKSLPSAGRPDDFTGIVSEDLRVEASISHEEMNVGDPVTLRVRLNGVPSPDNVRFPPLESFEVLDERFTLGPNEMSSDTQDETAVFSQTIRVKNDAVTEVPPLEVSYFNTRTERYEVAASPPIPITVRETRVLTVDDLEGGGAAAELPTTTVQDWREGIRFNYSLGSGSPPTDVVGLSLVHEDPLLIALLVAPVVFFGAVLLRNRRLVHAARAQSDEVSRQSVEAEPDPYDDLERLHPRNADEALELLRAYLAARLGLSAAERTIPEITSRLADRGVGQELTREISALLSEYESRAYWGGILRDGEAITRRVEMTIRALEEVL